jgi:hypothetical protein
LPKREIKNLGFEKSHFEGFQSLEAREKKSGSHQIFYIWFSLCSPKKYIRTIKEFYFISDF